MSLFLYPRCAGHRSLQIPMVCAVLPFHIQGEILSHMDEYFEDKTDKNIHFFTNDFFEVCVVQTIVRR